MHSAQAYVWFGQHATQGASMLSEVSSYPLSREDLEASYHPAVETLFYLPCAAVLQASNDTIAVLVGHIMSFSLQPSDTEVQWGGFLLPLNLYLLVCDWLTMIILLEQRNTTVSPDHINIG